MFQHFFVQSYCMFVPKNAHHLVSPSKSPVSFIFNSQSCIHGVKPVYSHTGIVQVPCDIQHIGQVKSAARTLVRNGLRKSCVSYRCKEAAKSGSGNLILNNVKYIFNQSVVIRIFQRLYRSHPSCIRNLGRITLGSALFVPTTFFQKEPPSEVKPIPIEIPKETKKVKNESIFTQYLIILYEFLRLFMRGLRLFLTFAPVLVLYPVTFFGDRPSEAWWGLLLKAIEVSGPILIKFGQWASTRRDLFPDDCCRQFARLQRRTQPHSWNFTKYRMRKAFGPNWRKVFVKFDNHREPIGSGCVAQVYKVWIPKDAVPDQELLEEIISDLDDNSEDAFEALHVQGFSSIFDDEESDEQQAMDNWKLEREVRRAREKEKADLLAKESEEKSLSVPELDISAVTESVASGIVSGEGFQPVMTDIEETGESTAEPEIEHPLVEAWSEADLDKSLPVEEAPPDDLEDLIPVAVKVLHPSVHTYFRRDLKIMRACATFITCIYPPLRWLALPQCVDEFAEVMSGQINLKKEAVNLEYFTEHFADVPSVRFPRPLRPYVTQKVMVETFEDGENMSEFIGASGEDKPEELKKNLAKIGVDALLKMIFIDNLVHGDMHPGNMLIQNITVTEDGVAENSSKDVTRIMMVDVGCDTFVMDVQPDPNPLRICLLDCGVVAKLKESDLTNFKAVFKQVVLGDGESVAELFLENSEHNCKDPEAFKMDMTTLVETARENTISLGQVDVGVLLQQVLGTLLKHQIRLESAFSAVVLAVFVLEGIGRTLDPNMDILERARPILVTGKM